MRKYYFILILFSTTICVSLIAKPFRLNYLHYPPLSWKENGKMKGLLVDILTEALQNRLGITLEHKQYPWKRAQDLVRTDRADAFCTVPTPKRREYTDISSESVVEVNITLFTYKNHNKLNEMMTIKSVADLRKFQLIDYYGNGWAKRKLVGLNINWVPTEEKVLKLLATKRRGDIFIQNSFTHYHIKKLKLEKEIIEVPNVILETASFNLCVGKRSVYNKIIPKFDQTIKQMRVDGTLQKIQNKYLK